MNYRIVCNVLGKVLLAEALLLMLPLAAALACAESPLPFIFTILPLAAAGGGLSLVEIRKPDLFAREGFVIVGLSWILMYTSSFNHFNNPARNVYYYAHHRKELEALRSEVTLLKSHRFKCGAGIQTQICLQ